MKMAKSVKTVEPEIVVTKIKNRWHGRLIVKDVVYDEMACNNSLDIGWICREMLRWYSKMGGISHRAEFARDGNPECRRRKKPVGRIWPRHKLADEKLKRKL